MSPVFSRRWCVSLTLVALSCGAATEGRWRATDNPLPALADGETEPGPPHSASGVGTSAPPAPAVFCDPEPLWTQGEVFEEASTPSWLVQAAGTSTLLWTLVNREPRGALFDLGSGKTLTGPSDELLPDEGRILPPWAALLGNHAVSVDFVRRMLAARSDLPTQPEFSENRGSLAVTPDGRRLVHSRCAGSNTQLELWNLAEPLAPSETITLERIRACPTSVILLNDWAVIADTSALRFVDFSDGEVIFSYPLPGPSGRLDLALEGERVVMSVVPGNLRDLEPGLFEAYALVLYLPPLPELRAQFEIDEAAALELIQPYTFVIGGALVPDEIYEPGYISLPNALHPNGETVATFSPQEDLVLTRVRSARAGVLQAADLPSAVTQQMPRTAGLPAALDFSADGRFLASVRGRQLSVYACAEQE